MIFFHSHLSYVNPRGWDWWWGWSSKITHYHWFRSSTHWESIEVTIIILVGFGLMQCWGDCPLNFVPIPWFWSSLMLPYEHKQSPLGWLTTQRTREVDGVRGGLWVSLSCIVFLTMELESKRTTTTTITTTNPSVNNTWIIVNSCPCTWCPNIMYASIRQY